jgi:hypothetical protein
MQNKKKRKNQKYSSLQNQMDVSDIKKGTIVLKDGSLRMILAVSSINFDLKSSDEKEAIILSYQEFLNTLDFPIQILISSKRFDVDPYLEMLEKREKKEEKELLKNQINDYVHFIKELTQVGNIMSTLFYVIIPFYPIESKEGGILEKLSTSVNPRKAIYQKRETFETYRNQTIKRVEQVKGALGGMGLHIASLETSELIELFYNSYNPSEFEFNTIKNIEKIKLEN